MDTNSGMLKVLLASEKLFFIAGVALTEKASEFVILDWSYIGPVN